MAQDGREAPASSAITPPARLQVVLLGYNSDGEMNRKKDRYGVIRFPQSYEDAIAGVEHTLGEYLPGGKADSIDIFCQMLNRYGYDKYNKWVWSQAAREDWDLVRAELALTGSSLGIRVRNDVQSDEGTTPLFVKGPVTLTYGAMKNGVRTWTSVGRGEETDKRTITRPESYQEAIESIVAAVQHTFIMWPYSCRLLAKEPPSDFLIKFCYFTSDQSEGPNTTLWADFPPSAYEDDEIWRAIVPSPYKILGMTAEKVAL